MKLSSSDRKSLVKLAGTLPKGSAERRAILSGLKKARMAPVGKPLRLPGGDNYVDMVDKKGLKSTYIGDGDYPAFNDLYVRLRWGRKVKSTWQVFGRPVQESEAEALWKALVSELSRTPGGVTQLINDTNIQQGLEKVMRGFSGLYLS